MKHFVTLDTVERTIQHENLTRGRVTRFIQQDYYPLLKCTVFWYAHDKPLIRNQYTVASWKVKVKN